MKTVAVIGGGITGLSAMYHLQQLKNQLNTDIHLVLIEASEQLGGKICSVRGDEFIIEAGADSIVARKDGVSELIAELNLEADMVYNSTGKSYIYQQDQLLPIPEDTVFGIPMSPEALFSSQLVSHEGKIAAMKDFFTSNTTFTKDDSVGEFLEYFLGKELVQQQIAPVLSGVYSGSLNELTLATTLPYLLEYKNQYGSIMRGLAMNKSKFQSNSKKKFISFNNGLSTIIDRMEEALINVEILKGTKATAIQKKESRYLLSLNNESTIEVDAIIISTPHQVAQQLLNSPALDEDFNQLRSSSLISVYLGFDLPTSHLPADGTGFIAPENSSLVCNACTWTSKKWTHTSKDGHLLLRLFYKNTDQKSFELLTQLTEERLVQVALDDVQKSLGISAKPTSVEITNWSNLMPKYHLTHHKTINSLANQMEAIYPNILLAGCSYYGVGIADCLNNGREIAQQCFDLI